MKARSGSVILWPLLTWLVEIDAGGIIVMEKQYDSVVELAKAAVEAYVRDKNVLVPENITEEMKEQAGVFVSIKKHGNLRGCIGTFEPTKENIAEEVVSNAISSAMADYRFSPIIASELDELTYSVDILTRPEPVKNISELDPKKYGVIVESGFRRGLLLPDLEGVNTVAEQIQICRVKAGISSGEPVTLYRFEVRRFK
jgi:AmmeMemoRadiSam system protein A